MTVPREEVEAVIAEMRDYLMDAEDDAPEVVTVDAATNLRAWADRLDAARSTQPEEAGERNIEEARKLSNQLGIPFDEAWWRIVTAAQRVGEVAAGAHAVAPGTLGAVNDFCVELSALYGLFQDEHEAALAQQQEKNAELRKALEFYEKQLSDRQRGRGSMLASDGGAIARAALTASSGDREET
jgi:hypothetical protein